MRNLIAVTICLMMLVTANIASATIYNSGYVAIPGGWLNAGQSQSWDIPIWNDFQIPYDHLNSATLSISAISTTGTDGVYVNNLVTAIGSLDPSHPSWTYDTTLFPNIATIFTDNGWATGNPLHITVVAGGHGVDTLKLGMSWLTLDYTNYDAPPASPGDTNTPTPEPGTLMLLGSGLSGLAFWGKRRKVSVA